MQPPVKEILIKNFDLTAADGSLDDDVLFQQLTERIRHLLATRIDFFMSLMYRLDVSEDKIRQALAPGNPEPPDVALARLIINRQVQRAETKERYRQDPLTDWMDF